MAPNSRFRPDDVPKDKPPSEGVRLLPPDEVAKVAERSETARRKSPDEKKYGDRPEPPPKNVKPAMRFPLADTADPNDFERPRMAPVTPPTADDPTGSRTVLSVGPPSGETTLPHWTEPATGEVPRVLIGEDEPEDDDGKWAAFTASAPRWKDQNTDWELEQDGIFDDLIDDDEAPLGALDETERPMDEEFLTFDDLDVPDAAPPQAQPLGTAADPIKIHRSGRAPISSAGTLPRPTRAPNDLGGPPDRGVAAGSGPVAGGTGGGGGRRDQEEAIRVGVAIAAGALFIFVIGIWVQWFPLILICAAVVFACAEFFSAASRAGFRPIQELGLLAAGALPVAAYFAGTPSAPAGEAGMMLVLFLTVAATMAWYLFGAGKGRPVANIAITLAGVLYVGALGAYAALILRAGAPVTDSNKGVQFFILIALGTTMCDVGAYLLGSRIGKTPLSEVSPNKTREGLAAGFVVSVVFVVFFGGVVHLGVSTIGQALVLGIVVAAVAPLGDLFESMIKRDLGVKDMGNIIPSHGGVLDRLDAYLFTLPAAYYTLRMLGLF